MLTRRALTVFSLGCAIASCALVAMPLPALAKEGVPLAVAVQDAVPAGRVVVYSPAVDMSAPVQPSDSALDWSGRVRAMAAQVGLVVKEDGNVLFIGPAPEGSQQRAQEAWVASVASLPPDTEPLKIVEDEASSAPASLSPEPEPVAPVAVTPPVQPAAEPPNAVLPVAVVAPTPDVSAPETTAVVPPPSVRLGEGTLMSTPTQDPHARASRRAAAKVVATPADARPPRKSAGLASEDTTPVAPPAARLVEGTLMGKPTADPRAAQPAPSPVAKAVVPPPVVVEPAPKVVAASERAQPAPAAKVTSVTGAVPETLVPAPEKTAAGASPPALPPPEMARVAALIEQVKPRGVQVIYASNVDRSARIPVPQAAGTWQEKMAAVARAGDLRIEDVGGTLFVNRATQAVSLDPSYPRPVAAVSQAPEGVSESAPAPAPDVAVASAPEPETPAPVTVAEEEPAAVAKPAKRSFWERLGLWESASPVKEDDGGAGTPGRREAAVTVQPAPPAPVSLPEPPATPVAEPALAAAPVVAARPEKADAAHTDPAPVESDVAARAAPVAPDMTAAVGSNFEPSATRPVPAAGIWRAERGSSLHDILTDWCQRGGVQLVWSSQYDFPLQASISLDDSFEGAVRTLLSGFASAAPRPVGRLHRQANFGMRVLVIQTNGNRYGE